MGDYADDLINRIIDGPLFERDLGRDHRQLNWQPPETITWTTKDGRKLLVRDMEQSHRINTLAALKRKNSVEAVKASRIGWALNYYIKKWDEEHPPLGSLEDDNG